MTIIPGGTREHYGLTWQQVVAVLKANGGFLLGHGSRSVPSFCAYSVFFLDPDETTVLWVYTNEGDHMPMYQSPGSRIVALRVSVKQNPTVLFGLAKEYLYGPSSPTA